MNFCIHGTLGDLRDSSSESITRTDLHSHSPWGGGCVVGYEGAHAAAHGKVAAYSIRPEKRRLSGTYGQTIFTGPNAFVS